jgi:hypothetical protein
MKVIKIMPDYQCFPLWNISPGIVENIDPTSLNISSELKLFILDWSAKYDNTLNKSNPAESGFKSIIEEIGFEQQGLEIWKGLLREMGNQYQIYYFSYLGKKIYGETE